MLIIFKIIIHTSISPVPSFLSVYPLFFRTIKKIFIKKIISSIWKGRGWESTFLVVKNNLDWVSQRWFPKPRSNCHSLVWGIQCFLAQSNPFIKDMGHSVEARERRWSPILLVNIGDCLLNDLLFVTRTFSKKHMIAGFSLHCAREVTNARGKYPPGERTTVVGTWQKWLWISVSIATTSTTSARMGTWSGEWLRLREDAFFA